MGVVTKFFAHASRYQNPPSRNPVSTTACYHHFTHSVKPFTAHRGIQKFLHSSPLQKEYTLLLYPSYYPPSPPPPPHTHTQISKWFLFLLYYLTERDDNLFQSLPVDEALDAHFKPPGKSEGVELSLYLCCKKLTHLSKQRRTWHAQIRLIDQLQKGESSIHHRCSCRGVACDRSKCHMQCYSIYSSQTECWVGVVWVEFVTTSILSPPYSSYQSFVHHTCINCCYVHGG